MFQKFLNFLSLLGKKSGPATIVLPAAPPLPLKQFQYSLPEIEPPITAEKVAAILAEPVPTPPPPPPPPKPVSNLLNFTKGTVAWYKEAYAEMVYDVGYEKIVEKAADLVLEGFARYAQVSAQTTIPWWWIGCIHHVEATCSFAGVLHNGELIIGTGKKTSLVPAGRGPFKSWEDAAIDALFIKGLNHITDWSAGSALRVAESWNGNGYRRFHPSENTPYLWAQTTINDGAGKYTTDGSFDPNADTHNQTGFAAIMKELEKRGKIKF